MKIASLNLLVIYHGLWYGGAQISILEFLKLIKNDINIRIITCQNASERSIKDLINSGYAIRYVPCKQEMHYPEMSIDSARKDVNWADIAWITDVEYLVAPRIKKIKSIPIVAHLHSYALLCPWWGLLYGMRSVCNGCDLGKIIRCKQLINDEFVKLGIMSSFRGNLYKLLDFVKGPIDYARLRMLLGDVVESIDGFIAVSRFVEDIHRRLLGLNKSIKMIYNPVTTPLEFLELNPTNIEEPRDDVILYASGSNPVKGPHLALEALKILVEEGYKVKMIMTGSKGSWVEAYAKRINVSKYVEFADKIPPEQFYKLMSRAKAVIMPSIWPEPFGRIPVEANRLGTPAVVTNRGGLPETIINGETGFIVEPSSNSLATGLMRIFEARWRSTDVASLSLKHLDPYAIQRKFFEYLNRIV